MEVISIRDRGKEEDGWEERENNGEEKAVDGLLVWQK